MYHNKLNNLNLILIYHLFLLFVTINYILYKYLDHNTYYLNLLIVFTWHKFHWRLCSINIHYYLHHFLHCRLYGSFSFAPRIMFTASNIALGKDLTVDWYRWVHVYPHLLTRWYDLRLQRHATPQDMTTNGHALFPESEQKHSLVHYISVTYVEQ